MYDRWNDMDEFEDFLQENADAHKLYPSDVIWKGIQKSIQPTSKRIYPVVALIFVCFSIVGKIHDGTFFSEAPVSRSIVQLNSISSTPSASETGLGAQVIIPSQPSEQTKFVLEEQETKNMYTERLQFVHSSLIKAKDVRFEHFMVTPASSNAEEIIKEEEIAEGTLKIAGVNSLRVKRIESFTPRSISEEIKKLPKSNLVKFGWQLHISPTTSYRKLSGKGLPYYTNAGNNVENSVIHKPSLGFEMGGAVMYSASKNIRLKAGLQFNVNRYEVQAFHSVPEVTLMAGNSGTGSINAVSTFRNFNGFSKTWLKNQHIMMSFPVGVEWAIFGNDKIQFNIASTIQPTIVVNNQAYMISANMANYAKAPALYKEFNIAAGAEAFISIKGKSLKYNLGPQFRYQLFSSYKKPYPISEHLTDYGIKLSIGR